MQLGSDSSVTPSDLIGLVRFLTGTKENTSAFSATDIKALLNLNYRRLQSRILAALNYDWKENTVDGTGTGLVNLVADQQNYSFPTDMIQIDRVELNYDGETDGFELARITPMQGIDRAISNLDEQNTIVGSHRSPVIYIRNNTLYLDPVPNQAVTGGMKIWGVTLITDLAQNTDEPVFSDSFHQLIAYPTARTWCGANDKRDKLVDLERMENIMFAEMVDFYSTRESTAQPRLEARRVNFR